MFGPWESELSITASDLKNAARRIGMNRRGPRPTIREGASADGGRGGGRVVYVRALGRWHARSLRCRP